MSKLGESILSVVAVGETRFRISKMISRIGHRPQKAFWGITLSLEALGRAPGVCTPSQSGLWAGVVILEITLLNAIVYTLTIMITGKSMTWCRYQ